MVQSQQTIAKFW